MFKVSQKTQKWRFSSAFRNQLALVSQTGDLCLSDAVSMWPQCYIKAGAMLLSCHCNDHCGPSFWPHMLCFLCNEDNEVVVLIAIMARNPRENIFRGHGSFPCPIISFSSQLVVLQLLLRENPKTNVSGKQTAFLLHPLPNPSSVPRGSLAAQLMAVLLGCHRKGKASLITERFFSAFKKIIVFRSCSAMGRIIKGYSYAGVMVLCYTSAFSKSCSPLGNDSLVSKPMINEVW